MAIDCIVDNGKHESVAITSGLANSAVVDSTTGLDDLATGTCTESATAAVILYVSFGDDCIWSCELVVINHNCNEQSSSWRCVAGDTESRSGDEYDVCVGDDFVDRR